MTKPKPEAITQDEQAYHVQVFAAMQEAQAVLASWGAHLTRKYELGPEDGVDPEGNIVRGKDNGS